MQLPLAHVYIGHIFINFESFTSKVGTYSPLSYKNQLPFLCDANQDQHLWCDDAKTKNCLPYSLELEF